MELRSDLWIRTGGRGRKEVTEEASIRIGMLNRKVTEIYSTQSQFKHGDFWHSHVWYMYQEVKGES